MTGVHHQQQLDRRVSAVDRHVGSRIRLRRRAVGLAQHQLADSIGVTNQQVHKYEKGIDRITAAQLHAIALALGTDAAFFFEHVELSLFEADHEVLHHRLVRADQRRAPHRQARTPASGLRVGQGDGWQTRSAAGGTRLAV